MIKALLEFIQNIIIAQILYNTPLTRILVALLVFFLLIFLSYLKYITYNAVTLDDYKIHSRLLTFFILISSFCTYILLTTYWRILNMAKSVNIYELLSKMKSLIQTNTYFSIMSMCLLLLSLLLLALFLLRGFKATVLIYCLQIHFWLFSKHPLNLPNPAEKFDYKQPYNSLKWLLLNLFYEIRSAPFKLLEYLHLVPSNSEYNRKLCDFLYNIYKLYGFFCILIVFIYDLIINHGVITKIYYLMPIVFIYFLLCKLQDLFTFYEQSDVEWIVTILYVDVIDINEEYIRYANGFTILISEFEELLETIKNKHKS